MDTLLLIKVFVEVDDFIKGLVKENYIGKDKFSRCRLDFSEIITITICYHYSGYKNFKHYYCKLIKTQYHDYFNLVSYNRFVELMRSCFLEFYLFSKFHTVGKCTGISYVDSTTLKIAHVKREKSIKLFKGIASKSKSSMGFYIGFKYHLVINHHGEIIDHYFSNSITPDIKILDKIVYKINGKLFGDKGYVSKDMTQKLKRKGIELITKIRKNMKPKIMSEIDKILLKKRMLIESVFDVLKNTYNMEHSRHRSKINFLINIFSVISAYHFNKRKPHIQLEKNILIENKMS